MLDGEYPMNTASAQLTLFAIHGNKTIPKIMAVLGHSYSGLEAVRRAAKPGHYSTV